VNQFSFLLRSPPFFAPDEMEKFHYCLYALSKYAGMGRHKLSAVTRTAICKALIISTIGEILHDTVALPSKRTSAETIFPTPLISLFLLQTFSFSALGWIISF
jgi:hypothetical protein